MFAKEVLEDNKETWIIPGGKVEFGESLEEAAKREIKEELGVDITITRLIDFHEAIHTNFNYHTIIFFFLATATGSIQHAPEILEAKYATKEELTQMPLVKSATWLFEKHKEL